MPTPPTVGAFDAPTITLEINDTWTTYLTELIAQAARPAWWDGTETQQLDAVRQVEAIIEAVMRGNVRETIGEVKIHARQELPEGWLWCDGATYNRVDYPELYAALHSNFRLNADTFKVPDMALRFPFGMGEGSPSFVGGQAGEQSHTLTAAEMPAHTHPTAVAGQQFVTKLASAGGLRPASAGSEHWLQPLGGAATGSAGLNQPHNNMPPYTFMFYAIVAK